MKADNKEHVQEHGTALVRRTCWDEGRCAGTASLHCLILWKKINIIRFIVLILLLLLLSLKIMVDGKYTAAQPMDSSEQDLLPRRDVTSLGGPKVNVPKSCKDSLSSDRFSTAIVSHK